MTIERLLTLSIVSWSVPQTSSCRNRTSVHLSSGSIDLFYLSEVFDTAIACNMLYCATGCPSGFTYVREVDGCYKPVKSLKTWSAASQHCRTYHPHAHLAFINSAEEQNAIKTMLAQLNHTYRLSKSQSVWL